MWIPPHPPHPPLLRQGSTARDAGELKLTATIPSSRIAARSSEPPSQLARARFPPASLSRQRYACAGADTTSSRTFASPARRIPSRVAAAVDRSITRPGLRFPRSLIRTTTDLRFRRLITLTNVPNGSVGWHAVSASLLKISPLAVCRPSNRPPYHDAIPCSSFRLRADVRTGFELTGGFGAGGVSCTRSLALVNVVVTPYARPSAPATSNVTDRILPKSGKYKKHRCFLHPGEPLKGNQSATD